MLFSMFLFLQSPLSSDAHACVNAMDEDKKSTNGVVPKGKRAKGENTPKNAQATPQKENSESSNANPKQVQEPKQEKISPPKTKEQPEKTEIGKTAAPEQKQASSCSSFGLVNSLWMFVCTLPFLARFPVSCFLFPFSFFLPLFLKVN